MRKTAAEAPTATVNNPRFQYASSTATIHPPHALAVEPVHEKIAGNVIAANTEYGT